MIKEKLYIVRGTGFSIDGTVVTVVSGEGDYSLVSSPNNPDVKNIMVKTKCLQPIDSAIKSLTYVVEVVKYVDNKRVDEAILDIPNSIRDVDVGTIIEYLDDNLSKILRME